MLLIHPPMARPCEPPPGVVRLAGALKRHGVPCRILDAGLECVLGLLEMTPTARDTWTCRALRHLPSHIHGLCRREGYANPDRYRRAVLDINRVLEKSTNRDDIRLSLANYRDRNLSPQRSRDLIKASEDPERSPFYPYFSGRMRQIMEEEDPRAAGFSLNYQGQALSCFAMIGFLRREWPGLKVILGGGLVTSWMRRCGWQNPFSGLVDEMVAGPGEEALLSFMGVDYDGGTDIPDYDPILGYRYLAPGFILPYSASTGCYWHRCSFCPERAEGNPYRSLPPQRVLEDVRSLARKSKPILVHFVDNAMSPALLEEIARQGLGLPWYGFVRATHHLADPEFCLALRRSGCLMLKLGLESGDQEVLDDLQKGVDLEIASRTLRAIKGAGIGTYVYLLFGTPPETPEKAKRTLAFAVRHGEFMDFLNLAIFNMPVDGPDAEMLETGPFYEGDLSLYTGFAHPSGWDRSLVRGFLEKEFKRHPVIASILRRDPPFFTSSHAPFFVGGWGSGP